MSKGFNTTYNTILKPILFWFSPETAQRLTLSVLTNLEPALPGSFFYPQEDEPQLSVNRWGIQFSNPVGLGAGVDKNLRAGLFWQKFGFGFAELGTVTPNRQFGNPRPRIWRLPEQRALVNSLGFPSRGSEWAIKRTSYYRRRGLRMKLALNLGPNKTTPPNLIIGDYVELFKTLGPLADLVVLNVSSPNTPGLRNWQAPERMVSIIEELRSTPIATTQRPPMLIKLGPDLDRSKLDDICAAALEHKVDGIVATNTTLQRSSVGVDCEYPGGLSGHPLRELARESIRRVYDCTRGQIPIIGVGGIASAEDAYAHIRAGASLVEFCTGLIYKGPSLATDIKVGLLSLLKNDGFRSIDEAVGTENGRTPIRQSGMACVA
jgi:dihydroorotate dehydrogenase